MLDLCRPLRGLPLWLQWITLLISVACIIGIQLRLLWLFGPAFITLLLLLLYGLFQQALRLIRGESITKRLTGKPLHLDERQVRNDLIAVDIAWTLNILVVIGVWYVEKKGMLPHGWWLVLVLGVGFIFRFSIRWLLDRYA